MERGRAERRAFLAAVGFCLLIFAVASGAGIGGLDTFSATGAGNQTAPPNAAAGAPVQAGSSASAGKALASIDGEIAALGANLEQATADLQEVTRK